MYSGPRAINARLIKKTYIQIDKNSKRINKTHKQLFREFRRIDFIQCVTTDIEGVVAGQWFPVHRLSTLSLADRCCVYLPSGKSGVFSAVARETQNHFSLLFHLNLCIRGGAVKDIFLSALIL